MNKLSVSLARDDDVVALVDLFNEATRYKQKHGDKAWGSDDYSEDEVRQLMARGDMYVVRLGDELVGTFSLQWEDEDKWGPQPPTAGYLCKLAIAGSRHGQGLGAQLVDSAEKPIREKGRRLIRLDCDEDNTGLCSYYEKLGFVKVGTKVISDEYVTAAALYERNVN